MKRLRAAVIGVGYLGRFHAQKYKALETEFGIELVGVCDRNPEQAARVAGELGVRAFTDPQELVGLVDMVTIATVTQTHFQVAELFLSRGIHCLVEKPMTVTLQEARTLIDLAQKKSLRLAVGHSERFNPAYLKAKELLPNPVAVELLRHAPYKSRGADVSVVHDLMIHDLDLLGDLIGGDLQLTEARGGVLLSPTLDWARASFQTAQGVAAVISASRVAPSMTRSLRLIGKDRAVVADLQTGDVSVTRFASGAEPVIENHQAGRGDNLLAETRAFVTSLRDVGTAASPGPGAVSGEDGLRALEWVQQVCDQVERAVKS